ncbi:myotubularin-related protein 12-like, partial [Diretmus argenteus]
MLTVSTCPLPPHAHCLHMPTASTCPLPPHAHYLHLPTASTCPLPPHAHCLHLDWFSVDNLNADLLVATSSVGRHHRLAASVDGKPDEGVQLFRNKLWGENDIPLSCVDNIYGGYEDKRKLITGTLVKNKYPSKIIIHCKDLRVFQFALTFCKEEDAKRIFQGIAHHCLEPKSLKNIFAFSFCESTAFPGMQMQQRTMMFDSAEDWAQDLKRTKGSCRLVTENAKFELSP